MAKVAKYNVWVHIEGVDKHEDCIEGDDHFAPHKAAVCRTAEDAEKIRDCLLEFVDVAVDMNNRLVAD
jgi:hypothetical protein